MQNNYALERDLIERASKKNTKYSKEDYEEVLRCLKISIKAEEQNGVSLGFRFPYLGVLYIKYDALAKCVSLKVRKTITNWQIRFETLLGEVMHKTLYKYKSDLRVRKGRLFHIKRMYGFKLEDLEKMQNNEFYK